MQHLLAGSAALSWVAEEVITLVQVLVVLASAAAKCCCGRL